MRHESADFVGPSMWEAWANRFFVGKVTLSTGVEVEALIEDRSTLPYLESGPTPFYDLLMRNKEHA